MQTTSANYQSILAATDHYFETKLVINGTTYSNTSLISVSTSVQTMAGAPCAGGAISKEIDVQILNPSGSVPLMAEMALSIRAISNSLSLTSEWIAQGTFYVDTRKTTSNDDGLNVLTIHGYDAMMKTVADYPDTVHNWPYLDKNVVAEIATTIGVTVDSRTNGFLTSGYRIDMPVGYTMRETLEHIASAYGGNFIITNDNKLLFVPLYGLEPTVTNAYYLAVENGNALTFGSEGWCVLV